MLGNQVKTSTKVVVTITFLIMVTVNALANILPINGQGTGAVSDSYANLFAPAGITFAIWGLIYLLLAGFTLYVLGLFRNKNSYIKAAIIDKIGVIFSFSSLANALWIFCWHYHQFLISVVLILVMLFCLIVINKVLKEENLTIREKILIRLPFSIYFGWITVATIANITTLLVSLNWNGFGIAEMIWAVIIIIVGMVIALAVMIRNQDIAYGLVLIWAYAGILIKHTSAAGFSGQYPAIITTVIICIGLFVLAELYLLYSLRNALAV